MPQRKQYSHAASRPDAYQEVTDRIISALEAGTVPWHKPWRSGGWPSSMSTGQRYRGVNVMLLGFTDYPSRWWGTYRQIQELGGQVRKGERSQLITFWKELRKEDPDATDPQTGEPEVRRIPMRLRTFSVFNYCQADHLPERFAPPERPEIESDATAEGAIGAYLATGTAATLSHDVRGRAYYDPNTDAIHLPPAGEHVSAARYYSTILHELGHSTGAKSRLARPEVCEPGKYAGHGRGREELTAEISACFALSECGIADPSAFEENANYVASWLEAVRADKRLVIQAASAAQKAADLIMAPSRQAEPEAGPGDMEAA